MQELIHDPGDVEQCPSWAFTGPKYLLLYLEQYVEK